MAVEVLKVLADVFVDNNPYDDDINLVKLLNAADSHIHSVTSSAKSPAYNKEYLEHRVKEIQVEYSSFVRVTSWPGVYTYRHSICNVHTTSCICITKIRIICTHPYSLSQTKIIPSID